MSWFADREKYLKDVPRSNTHGQKRPVPRHSGDFMEAVFPPEIFPMISDRFLPESTENWLESTGKKSRKIPVGMLLPRPAISGAFLQDPVTFPLLSCRILRDPVVVIFDLGYSIVLICTNEA
jgi:hypothetical protein